jgi:hypothetical protein
MFYSMLPELRSCVWKHVGGCEKCQQDSVYWMMHEIFQRLSKVCPAATCDPCTAYWCARQLDKSRMRDDRMMMTDNMTRTRDNRTMEEEEEEDKAVSCV